MGTPHAVPRRYRDRLPHQARIPDRSTWNGPSRAPRFGSTWNAEAPFYVKPPAAAARSQASMGSPAAVALIDGVPGEPGSRRTLVAYRRRPPSPRRGADPGAHPDPVLLDPFRSSATTSVASSSEPPASRRGCQVIAALVPGGSHQTQPQPLGGIHRQAALSSRSPGRPSRATAEAGFAAASRARRTSGGFFGPTSVAPWAPARHRGTLGVPHSTVRECQARA